MLRIIWKITAAMLFCNTCFGASLTYLKGTTYKDFSAENYEKEIITIDHFGLWKYGSLFFFYDISNPVGEDSRSEFFGSISAIFSYTKISGRKINHWLVRDWGLKTEVEHVSGFPPVYYYGLSTSLKIPHFRYFNFEPVLRDTPNKRGVGGQLNLSWSLPFKMFGWRGFEFQGFLAAGVIPEADDFFFLMTQPQILYDLSTKSSENSQSFFIGVEYSVAVNRFLLKGAPISGTNKVHKGFDEHVIQALAKVAF